MTAQRTQVSDNHVTIDIPQMRSPYVVYIRVVGMNHVDRPSVAVAPYVVIDIPNDCAKAGVWQNPMYYRHNACAPRVYTDY